MVYRTVGADPDAEQSWAAYARSVLAFSVVSVLFPYGLQWVQDHLWLSLLALLAFVLVASAVSLVVDLAARRTQEVANARAQAETLSTVAGSVLRGSRPLPALLDQVRETFQLTGVTLLHRRSGLPPGPDERHDPAAWQVLEAVGDRPCTAPGHGDTEVPVEGPDGDGLSLVLRGHALAAADRRVVEAFAAQAAIAVRQERLAVQAAALGPLAEADRLRTALLNAVSHDLRTPLASATAAVGGLLSLDAELCPADRYELLLTADESLERLARLVDNLLDMSRLKAGALAATAQPMSLAETLPTNLADAGARGRQVDLQIPEDLPEVYADPALVQRVLANLLADALRFSPDGCAPEAVASARAGWVEVRIVDHGPGVAPSDWETIFLPFQRLGDRDNTTGVGLGLALSRGLVEAMGGTLSPGSTLGGGLTMTLRLPAVAQPID